MGINSCGGGTRTIHRRGPSLFNQVPAMQSEFKTIISLDHNNNPGQMRVKEEHKGRRSNTMIFLSQWKRRSYYIYLAAICMILVFTFSLRSAVRSFAVSTNGYKSAEKSTLHTSGDDSEVIVRGQSISADGKNGGPINQKAHAKQGASQKSNQDVRARVKSLYENNLPKHPIDEDIPGWCNELMLNPLPLDKYCRNQGLTGRCEDGKIHFFSQFRQDYLLYTKHFKYLSRPGIYLDVAANDPYKISNTYFYEKCLAWTGICVEANPNLIPKLEKHRSCELIPKCVSNKPETVKFRIDGGYGGINVTNKNTRNALDKNGKPKRLVEMTCTMLKNVFNEVKVTHIDYFSLDVEGHELFTLQGVDWDQVTIDVLSVESLPNSPTDEFLQNLGYSRYVPEDKENYPNMKAELIYLAPGVVIGKPL